MLHMLPMCLMSAVLLIGFVLFLYRRDVREAIACAPMGDDWGAEGRVRRIGYIALFALVICVIVTRTSLWPWAVLLVLAGIAVLDRNIFKKVDYVLIVTFLCFFIFSSSIAANPGIAAMLTKAVAGHEYAWSIGLSQIISNVPATIVLYPFT